MENQAGTRRIWEGKLVGFYSSLSLGSNTVVTYCDTRVVAVSTVSETATIPMPPHACIQKVVRILHSGEIREHDFLKRIEGIECHIPDSVGETKCIEVQYLLILSHIIINSTNSFPPQVLYGWIE